MEDKRRRPQGKLILLLDFDGCVHSYKSGWLGATVITDPPVPGVMGWLEVALLHFDVCIYSARSSTEEGRKAMYEYVRKHAGPKSSIPEKVRFVAEKPYCFITIDDRCVCFEGNWSSKRFDPENLLKFKSWYEGK
jgi:hypothetical protein